MQITPEVLYEFAHKFAKERAKSKTGIIAAYLRGSLLYGSPLMGGVGDIDIVFIHNEPPQLERELVRLTPEIHYDIDNHDQLLYKEPRELRIDPWLGPTLHDARILYDPQHFLDYIQAGVRGQFFSPEYTLERAKSILDKARKFWFEHQLAPPSADLKEVGQYLTAIEQAINAIALLHGPPLTTRRLGLDYSEHAVRVNRPKLYQGFLALLGGVSLRVETIKKWIPLWRRSLNELPQELCPVDLHPYRREYYHQSINTLLESDHPKSALWTILKTWTKAYLNLPEEHTAKQPCQQVCQELGLLGEHFPNRLKAFDIYLEQIEEVLQDWSKAQGVS